MFFPRNLDHLRLLLGLSFIDTGDNSTSSCARFLGDAVAVSAVTTAVALGVPSTGESLG
jgi:hypothetical protein